MDKLEFSKELDLSGFAAAKVLDAAERTPGNVRQLSQTLTALTCTDGDMTPQSAPWKYKLQALVVHEGENESRHRISSLGSVTQLGVWCEAGDAASGRCHAIITVQDEP